MKRRALWLLSVMLLLLLVAPTLVAQNPNYNNGPVWRVVYIDVKAGMGDAFWTDIKQNFKPIYDDPIPLAKTLSDSGIPVQGF